MLESLWTVGLVSVEFLIRLGLVGYLLIRQHKSPSSRAAWIVVILALPVAGGILYVLVGEVRLGSRRVRKYAEIDRLIDERLLTHRPPRFSCSLEIPAEFIQIAHLAELTGGNQPRCGNGLSLINETDSFIQSLVEDIDSAERHCHLLFYIILTDHSATRVVDALLRAAAREVHCRLLVDSVGSSAFLGSSLRRTLEAGGVRVVEALPANALRVLFARIDLRNHRKFAVIDGRVGYVGSHNIADAEFAPKPRYAPWVDVTVRCTGPVVRDLQSLFVRDWYLDTEETLQEVLDDAPSQHADDVASQVIGTGPTSYAEAMRQLMISAFNVGREELVMTTPYFVPDDATATSLRTAARRGVQTTLILPARNDSPLVAAASRSHFESLLDAGVRICEYQKGLLHAKTLTIDRRMALVSTANLDRRSFELNFEVSLAVYDSDFASQVRFLQQSYLNDSREVVHAAWRRRGWPAKLWQNGVGILSPLL